MISGVSWKNAVGTSAPALILSLNLISPVLAWDDEGNRDRKGKPDWQGEWDAERARKKQEMKDFVGAVYRGEGNFVLLGDGMAVGPEGSIVRAGNTFMTPGGPYVKVGNTYLRPDGGSVVKAGSSFLSWDGPVVRAGNTYLGDGGNSVVAGNTVFRNFREKPGWSSR